MAAVSAGGTPLSQTLTKHYSNFIINNQKNVPSFSSRGRPSTHSSLFNRKKSSNELSCVAFPVLSGAVTLLGAGFSIASIVALPDVASAVQFPLQEPQNSLSLPTWTVHVSSVVEWITAMALVWQYGEKSGYECWKGLSWGMVPLLGGALCACTWHFFYNAESLEILVALQAALTHFKW
ncbi:hypothetical protein H6P81_016431 [Aristolochia fimbriata]|uniref:Ycf49-like protein n=1 Tax=Aristolochia fimbriata TaxID=158543 RepID=A0AAV7EB72_ARIFI|nr:hypothetical protein H6P81_016431 [Aristolochia fimbriata]